MNEQAIGGSGWGNFSAAEAVENIRDVSAGDMILNFCSQFNAKNIIKITRIGNGVTDDICYGHFVDPANPGNKRMEGDHEFAIWDHEISNGEYFFPQISAHDDDDISPCDVCHSTPEFTQCDKTCRYYIS